MMVPPGVDVNDGPRLYVKSERQRFESYNKGLLEKRVWLTAGTNKLVGGYNVTTILLFTSILFFYKRICLNSVRTPPSWYLILLPRVTFQD